MEEPGTDAERRLTPPGNGPGDPAAPDDPAEVERVRVRRARPPASPFGDTPIAGSPPAPDPGDSDEDEESLSDVAAWVRKAALVAALRTAAQACVAGIFMGIVLTFFLSGFSSGLAILLGLGLAVGAFPVALFAGYATYGQTVESERQRRGLCPKCGYDLRGLNTARCPECGVRLRPPRAWLAESDASGEDAVD